MIFPQSNLKLLLGLSFSSLALLYSIMLIGVYITASHQGLSCPDWPLCPNGFDIPPEKYFFEHIHRMMALITAAVIFATAIYHFKLSKSTSKSAVAADIIVVAQIFMGMVVVYSRLNPLIVAAHLSTGVLLFAMSLLNFLSSYRLLRNSKLSTASTTTD